MNPQTAALIALIFLIHSLFFTKIEAQQNYIGGGFILVFGTGNGIKNGQGLTLFYEHSIDNKFSIESALSGHILSKRKYVWGDDFINSSVELGANYLVADIFPKIFIGTGMSYYILYQMTSGHGSDYKYIYYISDGWVDNTIGYFLRIRLIVGKLNLDTRYNILFADQTLEGWMYSNSSQMIQLKEKLNLSSFQFSLLIKFDL